MLIREERPEDIASIHRLNTVAFDTETEARLVDTLREQGAAILSLVAEEEGEIIGHILFSPVILTPSADLRLAGLAPMAVLPQRQNQGIGSALVRDGIARCSALGIDAVVVLGHPNYYPRFGFLPAVNFNIRCDYDVPDEVFMVLELKVGVLPVSGGAVHYHQAFSAG